MHAAVFLSAAVLLNAVAASVSPASVLRSLSARQDGVNDGGDDGGEDGGDDGGEDGDGYLGAMCLPTITGTSAEGDDSNPTPCEAYFEIDFICRPNGTDAIDYIAQQECLCGSGSDYFNMLTACSDCMKAHGGVEIEDWIDPSIVSSASASFCKGTPTTDFDDLFGNMLNTAVIAVVTGTDISPNNTAISVYFTGTVETNVGKITGSAALATFTGSFTESATGGDNSFASVTTGLASGATGATTVNPHSTSKTASSSKTSATKTSSSSTSSTSAATATGNAAADVKAMSGMLGAMAAGVGILCAL